MNARQHPLTTNVSHPSFIPNYTGFLQRKCTCGSSPGLDGKCEECREKRLSRKSNSFSQTEPQSVPPIVQEVLRSPGQPLDPKTRAFMEPRFGHDFSKVRVHTDEKAEKSARALNSLAYTVGRDVVFGAGQYREQEVFGRGLIAHELTHVIQQTMTPLHSTSSSYYSAEQEAQNNSQRVGYGMTGRVNLHVSKGTLHQKDAEKSTHGLEFERGATLKSKKNKNKFSFTANVKVPLLSSLKLGPMVFLENLKIKTQGSEETENAIAISGIDISKLQTDVALRIVRLKVPELTLPKFGKLNLGANIESTGTVTTNFSELTRYSGSLGATTNFEAGYKSESALPPELGELTFGTKLTATGSLKQSFGESEKSSTKAPSEQKEIGKKLTPTAKGTANVEAGYESPPLQGTVATLGGLLGEESKITLGAGASFSITGEKEKKPTSKISTTGTIGLQGVKGQQPFIKLQIKGDVDIDLQKGKIDSTSQSLFFGIISGFKF
jgi:hypothetical protein